MTRAASPAGRCSPSWHVRRGRSSSRFVLLRGPGRVVVLQAVGLAPVGGAHIGNGQLRHGARRAGGRARRRRHADRARLGAGGVDQEAHALAVHQRPQRPGEAPRGAGERRLVQDAHARPRRGGVGQDRGHAVHDVGDEQIADEAQVERLRRGPDAAHPRRDAAQLEGARLGIERILGAKVVAHDLAVGQPQAVVVGDQMRGLGAAQRVLLVEPEGEGQAGRDGGEGPAAEDALDAPHVLRIGARADLVPGPEAVGRLAPQHHRGVVEVHDGLAEPPVGGAAQVGAHPRPGRGAGHHAGIAEERAQLRLDLARVGPVVGVVGGHEGAGGAGEPDVARGVGAAVARGPQRPDARVLARHRPRHLEGRVGAGVVHDQDLQVGVALRGERAQRGLERRLGPIRGHDHRHPAHGRQAAGSGRGREVGEGERPGRVAADQGLEPAARERRARGREPRVVVRLQARERQRRVHVGLGRAARAGHGAHPLEARARQRRVAHPRGQHAAAHQGALGPRPARRGGVDARQERRRLVLPAVEVGARGQVRERLEARALALGGALGDGPERLARRVRKRPPKVARQPLDLHELHPFAARMARVQAVAQMVQERVLSVDQERARGFDVEAGLELGVRVAAHPGAEERVVLRRLEAGCGHVRIGGCIPRARDVARARDLLGFAGDLLGDGRHGSPKRRGPAGRWRGCAARRLRRGAARGFARADGPRKGALAMSAPARRDAGGAPLLDPATLRALAGLMEPPEAQGDPAEIAAGPALAWLVGVLRPRSVVRLGTGGGAALGALARAAERLGGPVRILGVPLGEGEPGAEARRVARERSELVRLAPGARAAREEAGEVALLSARSGDAVPSLGEWRDALAPGGAVAIDAPDAEAAERATAALGDAFGDDVPRAVLGGLVLALPGAAPPAALGAILADAAVAAPLSALLGRLGRAARAEASRGAFEGTEALRGALRRAEDRADARLGALTEAQKRAVAALREAEALRREAERLARERAADDAAIARSVAGRERELHEARSRIASLEAETQRLERELAARFDEIALLTRERIAT